MELFEEQDPVAQAPVAQAPVAQAPDINAAIDAEVRAMEDRERQAGAAGDVPAVGSQWSDARIGQTAQGIWDNIQNWEGWEGLTTWPDRPSQEQVAEAEGAQLAATTRSGAAFGAQQTSEQNQRFIDQNIDIYGGGAEPVAVDAAYMTTVAANFPETYKYALSQRLANHFNKANNEKFDSSVFDVRIYEGEPTYYDPIEEKRKLFNPRGAQWADFEQFFVEHAPIVGGTVGSVGGLAVGPVTSLMLGSLGAGAAEWWRSGVGMARAGFEYSGFNPIADKNSDPDGVFNGIDFGVLKHPKTGDKVSALQVMVDSVGEAALWGALQVGGGAAISILRNSMAQLATRPVGLDAGVDMVASSEFLRSINPDQFLKAMDHYKMKQANGELLPYGKLGDDAGPTTSQVIYTYAEAEATAGRLESAALINEQAAKAARYESELAENLAIREGQEIAAARELGAQGETGLATSPRFVVEKSDRLGMIVRDTQTMEAAELPPAFVRNAENLQRHADDLNFQMGYPITALERDAAAGEAGAFLEATAEKAAALDPRLTAAQDSLAIARDEARAVYETATASANPAEALGGILPRLSKIHDRARDSASALFDNVSNAFTKQLKTTLNRVPSEYNKFDTKSLFQGRKRLNSTNTDSLLKGLDAANTGPGSVAEQASSMVEAAFKDITETVSGKSKLVPKIISYKQLNDSLNGINELFKLGQYSEGPARAFLTDLKNGLTRIRDERFKTIDRAMLSDAEIKAGKGLYGNLKTASESWGNYDNVWRESTLSTLKKFGDKGSLMYTPEQAAKDFFPDGNIGLQEAIIDSVLAKENPALKESLRNLFRVKLRNAVTAPVEEGAGVSGVSEIAPGVVGVVPPIRAGEFLSNNQGALNKLFTSEEIQQFNSIGSLSKAAERQAKVTEALQKKAADLGVILSDANVIGVHGLVEPMMIEGGKRFINSLRNIIFRDTANDPAALQAARQQMDAIRYAGAERMIFGEADLTAVGALQRISNPGAILKNIRALRGSYEALVGPEQAKNVKKLLTQFDTAFSKLRRPEGSPPATAGEKALSVVGTLIRPVVGVLNRRAITATAARNLFTMKLADSFKQALLNPQATEHWIKMIRTLKRGEDAAQVVGTALSFDFFDKDSEAYKAVLDSLHSSSSEEEYQRILYTGPDALSPEMQKEVGAEVRRGQSPTPEAPLSFLKDMDSDLRKEYPWLDKISGVLGTRPQDRPARQEIGYDDYDLNPRPGTKTPRNPYPAGSVQWKTRQDEEASAKRGRSTSPSTGISSLVGPEVLRNQEISKLVRGYNKGGIVNARTRQRVS